jgi:hypothetical protein
MQLPIKTLDVKYGKVDPNLRSPKMNTESEKQKINEGRIVKITKDKSVSPG